MALTESRRWHRVTIAGDNTLMSGEVVQSEQLEAWITNVATLELQAEPTIARGDAVEVWDVDLATSLMACQYAGVLNKRDGVSWPNSVSWTALGPLHRLRRVPTVDHALTTKTDGEAVKYVFDLCNVAYDPDDIQDAGYVLGAQTPIIWHIDQPGWEIVRELDKVFGMATIEVGQGRVVRFAYDRAPAAADIMRSFTRGVDADFWGNERALYDLDAIQNAWSVTGANWQDSDKCTLTVWAKASGSNAAFEDSGVRVKRQDFSSDVIQDEALAAKVAERMMRWWNRDPDVLTVKTANDPNVTPGKVVGVKDQVYSIGLVSPAVDTPYLVLSVDRRGKDMTLSCVGGAAGTTGTITHGVERRCNDAITAGDLPGSFDFPGIGGPPAIPWAAYDCSLHGAPGGEGTCPAECASLTAPSGCDGPSSIDGQAVTGLSWRMKGKVTLNADTDVFRAGVEAASGDYGLIIGGTGHYLLEGVFQQQYQFIVADRVEHLAGAVPTGVECLWAIKWDDPTTTLSMTFSRDGETWCESHDVGAGIGPSTGIVTVVGSPTRTDEAFIFDCVEGGGTVSLAWEADDGTSWSFGNPMVQANDGGDAHAPLGDSPNGVDWTITTTVTPGADAVTIGLGLADSTMWPDYLFNSNGMLMIFTLDPFFGDPGPKIKLHMFDDAVDSGDSFGWDHGHPIVASLSYDAGTNTLTGSLSQSSSGASATISGNPVDPLNPLWAVAWVVVDTGLGHVGDAAQFLDYTLTVG